MIGKKVAIKFDAIGFTLLEAKGDWLRCKCEILSNGVATWYIERELQVGDGIILSGIEGAKLPCAIRENE